MNKRRFFWSIGLLVIGVGLVLFVFVGKPKTQVAEGSQLANPVHVSHPAIYSGQAAQFSGDDLYDPSMNPSLLATQQACESLPKRNATYQRAVNIPCPGPVSLTDGIPAESSFSGDDPYDPAAGGLGN
jgi:hypothetical protein